MIDSVRPPLILLLGTALALALGLTGCGGKPGVPETAIEVTPVRFLYDAASPRPCEGTVPFLSQTADHLAQFLGVPLPPRIDYHYRAKQDLSAYCPPSAPACTLDQDGVPTVWSQYPTMTHELVHATFLPLQPVRFFAEGLAVALGGNDGNADSPPYVFTPEQLLDNDGSAVPNTGFFAIAGDFSSYLVDRWGASRYTQLNPMIPSGTPTTQVESAFAAIYGESISSAFSDRQSSGKQYAASRMGFPECSIDPTPWMGSVWSVNETVDCASNGISLNDALQALDAAYATIEIPADGIYDVTLRGDATTGAEQFSLQRCVSGEQFQYFPSTSPVSTHVVIAGQSPMIVAWLAAGRYFSQFSSSAAQPASFSVAVQGTKSGATTCAGAASASLDGDDGIYLVPQAGITLVASFSVSKDRVATAILEQTSLFLCDGSCDLAGAGCQTLLLGQSTPLSPGHQ